MKSEGHTGLALFLTAPIALIYAFFVSEVTLGIFVLMVVVFVNIPDLDVKISRSIIGDIIGISHRGFTHTIYFAFVCGLVTLVLMSAYEPPNSLGYVLGFLGGSLGILFHSFGDIVTPSGINLVPFIQESSYSFDWFNYNNLIANVGFLLLGLMSMGQVILYLTEPTAENLIYWCAIYLIFFPIILLSAKKSEFRYDSYLLSRYFNPFWWIKRLI